MAQQLTQFFAEKSIPPRLRSLPPQTVHLAINFRNDVGDSGKICARRIQSRFRCPLSHAKLSDARRLLDDRAPIHRLRGKDLTNAALLNDRVVASGQAGSREEILDVTQPARPVVQKIFALAGAIKTACNRHGFTGSKLQRQISTPPVSFVLNSMGRARCG